MINPNDVILPDFWMKHWWHMWEWNTGLKDESLFP